MKIKSRNIALATVFLLVLVVQLIFAGKEPSVKAPVIAEVETEVTDTEENLSAVAAFLAQCGVKYLEMMPYHALTGSKYALAGREYAPAFDGSREPDPHVAIFSSHGIEVKIL